MKSVSQPLRNTFRIEQLQQLWQHLGLEWGWGQGEGSVHNIQLILNHTTGCLKKNGILWKNGHKYLQTHPKCKIWGCFWKFRIFATLWALRFSKLKKKCLRKWSLMLPTPPPKIGRIHCSHYALRWWSSAFSWLAMKAELVPYVNG